MAKRKKNIRRGKRMQSGKGWRLKKNRRDRIENWFVGTLIGTINFGNKRLAIFSVPK
jgi:hypothetical protein